MIEKQLFYFGFDLPTYHLNARKLEIPVVSLVSPKMVNKEARAPVCNSTSQLSMAVYVNVSGVFSFLYFKLFFLVEWFPPSLTHSPGSFVCIWCYHQKNSLRFPCIETGPPRVDSAGLGTGHCGQSRRSSRLEHYVWCCRVFAIYSFRVCWLAVRFCWLEQQWAIMLWRHGEHISPPSGSASQHQTTSATNCTT